ncbi:MAG TPA: peptide deformylase [Gaiellaceae bacterium]|nr:peptide deformylase [Gaiellaceae bacterium]
MADEHEHSHDDEPAHDPDHEGHAHGEHDHEHHAHDHEHDHEHDHDDEHRELTEAEIERRDEQVRRAALAQIRQYPDVALRMKAKEVTEFDEFLMQLVERMIHLMGDAQGVGLAATQVGVLQRVFVFSHDENATQAIVNPRIVDPSTEKETEEEGCLSLEGVRVPVERSTRVTLEGVDPSGEAVKLELEGLSARVVQHEFDHLDGVLIIDRTDAEHRSEALGLLRPQAVLR